MDSDGLPFSVVIKGLQRRLGVVTSLRENGAALASVPIVRQRVSM